MCHWRLLPDITWGFCGDPTQPQILGSWRGTTCRNGLHEIVRQPDNLEAEVPFSIRNFAKVDRWSAYLPDKVIQLTEDKRSKCPILRDFRKRLREADESEVPKFIAEGRKLFRAEGPWETTIVISNAKRRKLCAEGTQSWHREHPDVSCKHISCDDLPGGFWLYVGLTLRGRFGARTLINGMVYLCTCLDPIELEEKELRWGESEKVCVTVSEETLGRESTLTAATTAASVQGSTCSSVCLADLANPHMRKKDLLEMATGRATHSAQLRFL